MNEINEKFNFGNSINNIINQNDKVYVFLNKIFKSLDLNNLLYRPIILGDRELINIKKNKHFVTTFKGKRYLLWCFKLNFVNCCLYIDKFDHYSFEPIFIIAHHRFDDNLFKGNGTIFDGEVYESTFSIIDILYYAGNSCLEWSFLKRYAKIRELYRKYYMMDKDLESVNIIIKDFYERKNIINLLNNLNETCEGLFFIPDNQKFRKIFYSFNTGDETYLNSIFNQNKLTNDMTNDMTNDIDIDIDEDCCKKIDTKLHCQIKKTNIPDIYMLFLMMDNELKNIGPACIPDIHTSYFIRELFNKKRTKKNIIVICNYHEKFNKWQPYEKSKKDIPDDYKILVQ
jgi:hypothetical protein